MSSLVGKRREKHGDELTDVNGAKIVGKFSNDAQIELDDTHNRNVIIVSKTKE